MIRHQAIRTDSKTEALRAFKKSSQVILVILMVKEHIGSPNAPLSDVVRGARQNDTRLSSH
jgi:hypothetical protein